MRGFVLAQLRRGGGRLVAAGIAIALGSAFVAAALLGSQIVKTTAYNSVSASYAKADLVAGSNGSSESGLSAETLAALSDFEGVASVSPVQSISFLVGNEGRSDYAWGAVAASDPRLEPANVATGRLPSTPDEVAIAAASAKRLGVSLGEQVTLGDFAEEGTGGGSKSVTLVGTLVDPAGFNYDSPTAIVVSELADELMVGRDYGVVIDRALILLENGASTTRVRDAMMSDADLPALATVRTVEETAHEAVTQFAGETDVLTGFVLTFAGIALVVAAIVIANTFQVLVAQRAHMLALLRCVGATRAQVRRSVLLEAALVGLVASGIGLGLGVLLAQAALWIVPTLDLAVPVPTVVTLSPAAILWPLAAGTLVTVLAALAPARLATRVAPLEALRPVELTPVRESGKVRLVLALVGLVGGGSILALATIASLNTDMSDPTLFVLAGILGGAISVTGILIGAVYFVPGAAHWLGSLATRFGGVPGKIAAANSVRNPRRTTATASALLIGAGLVTMMSTGAATARDSLDSLLDANYPVDIAVEAPWSATGIGALTPAQISAVERTEGVALAVPVRALSGSVETDGESWSDSRFYSASAEDVDRVSHSDDFRMPAPGTTALPEWMGNEDGATATVTVGGVSIELVNDSEAFGQLWLAEDDFARLGGDPVTTSLWISLAPGADARDVTSALRDTFTELSSTLGDPPGEISGAAVERAGYEEVISTVLSIIVGLLGVAVIIALVGVANTLSLSVLERRRESATLRAIGLRRGQVRQMLAIEGVIIAVVGAALGAVLGLVYGWAGSTLLLGSSGGLQLAMPWRDLGVILAVAVAAGLLASVLPSRTATRTPPVAALAVD